MSSPIDYSKITFRPACPDPIKFDVQARIQSLRTSLDPNLDPKDPLYQPEPQHVNIRTLIKLYEEKKIDGTKDVWVVDGKVVSEEEGLKRPGWGWLEGVRYQFAQKHAFGHGPFGAHFHELRMLLRLIPRFGGDGTVLGIIAMNDTGSDIISLFQSDLQHLGNIQPYNGWGGNTMIVYANGTMSSHPRIWVEVQMIRDDDTPWSDWIQELAIIQPDGPGLSRLSGYGIRNALYFGTSPGNHFLAVSATKGGLASLL